MSGSHIDTLAAPAIPPSSPEKYKRVLPWLVAVAFFMESLDTTILNTAVPTIASALHVTPLAMKSVLASYTLSLAVFIPISGWVADRFGTRRVFASAIGLFTLGSLLCGVSSDIRVLVACRILQGCGGAMMVPVGRLTLVRTFAKSELIQAMSFVAIPGLIGPMLGPIAGGLIVAYLHWRVIFFVNIPIGLVGLLIVYLHMPDYREDHAPPLDVVGLVFFGSGIGLLSYVLEVFGEHRLSPIKITGLLVVSLALIAAYWIHAQSKEFPLLRLTLFRIRTFASAVTGSFFTRIGIGGVPFLLPLLYQIGLGYTPVQSGLLIMPQAAAAMAIKFGMQQILAKIGYRGVLVSNTLIIGILLFLFGTIGQSTHVWEIVLLAFCYGSFTSLQYTSMNTLVFADIADEETSAASTIASTMQQMSMSFGVASAGLATTFFVSAGTASNPQVMIHGIHKSLYALGAFTVLSTVIFRRLKKKDGDNVSHCETSGKMLAAHGSA
jgi:EmrB/QacA subfamily drug resistance transporter